MPRPRRSHESREQLLEVGTQLITTQGYAGTGLKEILDTVGVPKGSFYNFFKSKEFFVAEIVIRYYERVKSDLEGMLERTDTSALEALRLFHSEIVEKVLENGESLGCPIGALAAEVGSTQELIHDKLAASLKDWLGFYASIIKKGQVQGEIRTDIQAEVLAGLVWGQWQGGILQFQVNGKDTDSMLSALNAMLTLLKPIKH